MHHRALSRATALAAAMVAGFAAGSIGAAAQERGHDRSPATAAAEGPPDEASFLAENRVAMGRMMAGMDVKSTGNVDADFAAMMISHHQGAIDMALAELRRGHNEQLRRIAQEIIVEQQQEILAMRLALGQELPASAAAERQLMPRGQSGSGPNHHTSSHGMTVSTALSPTRAQEQTR